MPSHETQQAPAPQSGSAPVRHTKSGGGKNELRGKTFAEQEEMLAPVQMKGGKRAFKRGTELSGKQSGSEGAREDYIQLMHGSNEWRAYEIHSLLTERKESQNQLFYHLQMLVMGDNGNLVALYDQVSNGADLMADLDAKLSQAQAGYIKSCVTQGQPDFEDKLMLAMGIITDTGCDAKEVEHLLTTEDIPDGDKRTAFVNWRSTLRGLIGRARYDALEARFDYQDKKEAAGDNPTKTEKKELRVLADEELAAIIRSCVSRSKVRVPMVDVHTGPKVKKVSKTKLAKRITDWVRRHTEAEHRYVMWHNSLTQAELLDASTQVGTWDTVLELDDVVYLTRIITEGKPVGDEFYEERKDTSTMLGEGKKEREDDKSEHGAKVAELRAKIGLKIATHSGEETGTNSKSLKRKIDKLLDEEKDWFLRSYLSTTEQQNWDDPDFDHSERMALRDKAIEALGTELKEAGLGHGGKLTELREKLQKRFEINYLKSGTLKRIKTFAKSKVPHENNPGFRGPKILSLIRKLRGDEFASLRSNTEVMEAIKSGVDAKHWERIEVLLGISDKHQTEDGVSGSVDSDLMRAQGSNDEKKYTREKARELGELEAELKPSHWGMMITSALKHSKQKKRTELNSLVTRALMAAKKRERLTKKGDMEMSGDQKVEPMTVETFMQAVEETITPGAMKIFEAEKKFEHALTALRNRTRPTVDEQIEDAKYINQMKRTSGDDLGVSKVEAMFQDLDGEALLEEWSNIQEFKDLKDQVKNGATKKERARARGGIKRFVIDIRRDRHKDLGKMLSPGSRMKVLFALRLKLVQAMQHDPEVIKTLAEADFDNDELSQAKTKTLALTDKQKQRSTGAQYNTLPKGTEFITDGNVYESSKSAQTKESMGELLGGHREAESELNQGKDRQDVIEGKIDKITLAQQDLERRGVSFDKMQKHFNRIITGIAKVMVIALVGSAMAALTVLTGGVGGILAVAVGGLMAVLKGMVMKAVKLGLEGDKFNTTKAAWDLGFKFLIGAAVGALAEFALPEVLQAVGQEITDTGANLLLEGATNAPVAPGDAGGHATHAALTFALGKGAKGAMKTAIREARSTEDNPALRQMVMLDIGGQILAGGFTVASEVYADFDEGVQNKTPGPTLGEEIGSKVEKKSSSSFSKALQKGTRVGRYSAMLRKALAARYKKQNKHGKDRDENLAEMIPGVLAEAHDALVSLRRQKKGLDDEGLGQEERDERAAELDEQIAEIRALRDELRAEYEAWQAYSEGTMGDDDQVRGATAGSVPLLMKAIELDELLPQTS